ncbi:MAG TPA: multicopper oxidase domain-containing protein [Bradyrhizobium sp.]|uniref:multicopper oxidase family protein n=1 Tax=Bradyrhizobium sp. TaxID=376 RepID=UPI002BD82C50|nr:multicopper oxidase domain-containing protein [Bradyrhizobium sp.]HLZ06420.1 multicopper oxidase domain-containing protein [Bradyrhizobium sp.]
MAKTNLLISRRAFLGGMGLTALGAWELPIAAATDGEAVLLQAKPATLALRPGQPETPVSALIGANPALRFKRGANLDITLQNDLQMPAAINWHGLDGIPLAEPLTGQSPLASGVRATVGIPLRQAGTLFGDLGLLASDAGHPLRALPLIVEEADPPPVDRDEILLIEEFRLRADGTAVSPGLDPKDALPVYTVNGLISPDIAVHSNERLRLRLINAGQRGVVAVKIEGLEVRVMALDGQPAEPFFARNGAVVLAPGGRADVFVDVPLPPGSTSQILLHDGKQARAIARLIVADEALRRAPLTRAPPLPQNDLPARLELRGAQRFEIVLSGHGWVTPTQFKTSNAPAFRVTAGRIVVLALTNHTLIATVFHLHGHHFRLLDRLDDGWKPYWLDTLAIEPGQTERIAFAAEHAGRWLIESTATDWAAPKLLRWYGVE